MRSSLFLEKRGDHFE